MKTNIIRNIFRVSIASVATLLFVMPVAASTTEGDNTFKIMTINVDGLPAKILLFDVNADGPQMGGSIKISDYIERQACDIVCMQENFNYSEAVGALLDRGYDHDEWSGGLFMDNSKIDWLHLQNLKFPCDGLTTYWKKGIGCQTSERVAWEENFGKFSHCFDDIITKGFRRYEIIYINPVGGKKVTPQSCVLDTEGYTYNEKPLGDHYPLIATFAYSDSSTTGIRSAEADTNAPAEYYDLGGRHQPTARKGLNSVSKGNESTVKKVN